MQADKKTIIRRCNDFLFKYATMEQVLQVAGVLGVDTTAKETDKRGNV